MPLAAIGIAVGAATSIAGGIMGSHAATNAANTQSQTELQVAQMQQQIAEEQMQRQQEATNLQVRLGYPYLQGGYGGLANLEYLMGIQPQGSYSAQPPQLGAQQLPMIPGTAGGTVPLSGLGGTATPQGVLTPGGQPISQTGDLNSAVGNQGILTPSPNADLRGAGGGVPSAPTASTNGQIPLSSLVAPGLQFGQLTQPFGEATPTGANEINDPGYQFRLQEGQKAIERSAAAAGGLLTGGTAKALTQYGQGYASNEFSNVWNRYLDRYNMFRTNQNDLYSRYMGLVSGTQPQFSQLVGNIGQGATNQANILGMYGQNVGNSITNAAAARASGYVGSANAWGGALSNLSQLAYLPLLYGQNQNTQGTLSTSGGQSTGGAGFGPF